MTARCPYCSAGVLASQAFCTACGRPLTATAPAFPNQAVIPAPPQVSPAPLMPASPASPGVALLPQSAPAGKEKRHHWIWLGNLITIGIGGYIIYAHWQGTLGLGVAIALFALAALSLGLSRFGARWQRASCLEKLLILPGVLAGLVAFVFIALSGSDSDSKSQSDKGSSHSTSDHSNSRDAFDFINGDSTSDNPSRRGMQVCPRCGQIVPDGMRVCPRCGQPLM